MSRPVAQSPSRQVPAPPTQVSMTVRAAIGVADVARIAAAVIRAEHATGAAMSITFVGPARMRTLNREHLGKDRATDVIAFALSRPPVPPSPRPTVVGDIYICPAAAAQNARRFGTTVRDETRRLVVHGVLHVLGYEHPDTGDRTRSAMWHVQERHLATIARGAR